MRLSFSHVTFDPHLDINCLLVSVITRRLYSEESDQKCLIMLCFRYFMPSSNFAVPKLI